MKTNDNKLSMYELSTCHVTLCILLNVVQYKIFVTFDECMSQLTSYHTFLLICLSYLYVLVGFYIMYGLLLMFYTYTYINGGEGQDG